MGYEKVELARSEPEIQNPSRPFEVIDSERLPSPLVNAVALSQQFRQQYEERRSALLDQVKNQELSREEVNAELKELKEDLNEQLVPFINNAFLPHIDEAKVLSDNANVIYFEPSEVSLIALDRAEANIDKTALLLWISKNLDVGGYGGYVSLEDCIDQVKKQSTKQRDSTKINYSGKGSQAGSGARVDLAPDSIDRVEGNWNPYKTAMVEAHEKGHAVRMVRPALLGRWLQKGFRIPAANEMIQFSSLSALISRGILSEEDIGEVKDYLFGGDEILERMAQIKSIAGIRGNKPFTKGHLNYVRDNWQRFSPNNYMDIFLAAITPDVENRFLFLINASGV